MSVAEAKAWVDAFALHADYSFASTDRIFYAGLVLSAEVDRLEAQLERTRSEYAAAIARIADAHLTVEECDRILAAIQREGL